MKRAGFTMIELIFVIVILGILAAVALPKFAGVTEQAKAGKIKAFVGTMNRTVLPAVWGEAMAKGYDGATTNITSDINDLTDVPEGVTITAGGAVTDFTANCGATPGTNVAVFDYSTGDNTGVIYCFEGNGTTSAFFTFSSSGLEANLTMQ